MKTTIITVMTLDGKISKSSTHDVDWTSKEDRQFFRDETKKAGVVIFGSNTYNAIGRPLPDRLNVILTRDPEKYKDKEKKDLLEFTNDDPPTVLKKLEERGFTEVIIGGGGAINALFLKEGLVNELAITVAPRIFGTGVPLFQDISIKEINLELYDTSSLGEGEVLLKYRVL